MTGLGAKPHQLAKQNEVIQRMLGGQGPHPSSGGMSSKPITSSREPLLATSELKDALGGTPKPPRKMGAPLAKRGDSQARVIEKEMVLPSVGNNRVGNTILHQKNQMGYGSNTGKPVAFHKRGNSSSGVVLTDQISASAKKNNKYRDASNGS